MITFLELSYFLEYHNRLNLTLNYVFEHYSMAPGALGYPRPEHKLKFGLDYFAPGNLTINLDAQITGPMKLRDVFGLAYNADGTLKRENSPPYAVFNLKLSREFSGGISLFVGVKNLLNFYQTNVESPLMYDAVGNPGDVISI